MPDLCLLHLYFQGHQLSLPCFLCVLTLNPLKLDFIIELFIEHIHFFNLFKCFQRQLIWSVILSPHLVCWVLRFNFIQWHKGFRIKLQKVFGVKLMLIIHSLVRSLEDFLWRSWNYLFWLPKILNLSDRLLPRNIPENYLWFFLNNLPLTDYWLSIDKLLCGL